MHVGRTVLSKDMMEVQKLIARTSKREKNAVCLLIQLKNNLTCTCVMSQEYLYCNPALQTSTYQPAFIVLNMKYIYYKLCAQRTERDY